MTDTEHNTNPAWIAEVVDGRTTSMHTLSFDPVPARTFWAAMDADVPA